MAATVVHVSTKEDGTVHVIATGATATTLDALNDCGTAQEATAIPGEADRYVISRAAALAIGIDLDV
jgi:hypothetical protein